MTWAWRMTLTMKKMKFDSLSYSIDTTLIKNARIRNLQPQFHYLEEPHLRHKHICSYKGYYDPSKRNIKRNATKSARAEKAQRQRMGRTKNRQLILLLTSANALTCLITNSQFIRTAALRYFRLSSRNRPDSSPIRSRLSPRYRRSSMFLVMIFATSRNSSCSLSRFCAARVFWYVALVR